MITRFRKRLCVLTELDSITLDTTGVVFYSHCDGSTGDFAFDHVSLNSPYVKLELSLAEAKERADKEIMSAVGLPGKTFDFDKREFAHKFL